MVSSPRPAHGEPRASAPARATLLDFFHDLAGRSAPFLVHDDGYRTWTYSYAEVGAAAARVAARLHHAGIAKGEHVHVHNVKTKRW